MSLFVFISFSGERGGEGGERVEGELEDSRVAFCGKGEMLLGGSWYSLTNPEP